jgi:hypothetical protein
MEQKEREALAKINRTLTATNREFSDEGTCLQCYDGSFNTGANTYITQADVSGKKMVVIICDDCGNTLPLFEI